MSVGSKTAIQSAIETGHLGFCISCDFESKWQLEQWTLRFPQLPRLLSTRFWWRQSQKAIHAREKLCASCYKISNTSVYIQGSCSLLRRGVETTLLPLGFTGLGDSAAEGCHMCSLLCGTIPFDIWKEVKECEARGESTHPIRVHILHPFQQEKVMYLCIGGKQPYQFPGTRVQGLAIRAYPNFDLREVDGVESAARAAPFTGSAASLDLAKRWISTCMSEHLECNNLLWTDASPTDAPGAHFFPTRLIDVRPLDLASNVRLYISSEEEKRWYAGAGYLALSHCWGKAPILRLTTEVLDDFIRKINLASLSQTFRDAIEITRRLGFRYLWIDSLCIIQDSTEDWKIESNTMGDVYQNAICTIAATQAQDGTKGCFFSRVHRKYRSCQLDDGFSFPSHLHPTGSDIDDSDDSFTETLESSPLFKRAWVVQERLLSPRMTHFGPNQLLWECRSSTATEDWPKLTQRDETRLMPSNRIVKALKFVTENHEGMKNLLANAPLPESSPHLSVTSYNNFVFETCLEFEAHWRNLVRTYTAAELTYGSDKLIAINGIANIIQNRTNMMYFAGLWATTFPTGLLWYVWAARKPSRPEPRAPTWSWAGIDSEIWNLSVHASPLTSRLQIVHLGGMPSGMGKLPHQVLGGYLVVKGAVKLARWKRLMEPSQRFSNYEFEGKKPILASNVTWYQYWRNEAFVLCDEESNEEAWLLPDTDTSITEPVLTCLRIIVETPSFASEETRRMELYRTSIRGLALQSIGPAADGTEFYIRVGYFELEPNFCDPFQWFEGCEEKQLCIC